MKHNKRVFEQHPHTSLPSDLLHVYVSWISICKIKKYDPDHKGVSRRFSSSIKMYACDVECVHGLANVIHEFEKYNHKSFKLASLNLLGKKMTE